MRRATVVSAAPPPGAGEASNAGPTRGGPVPRRKRTAAPQSAARPGAARGAAACALLCALASVLPAAARAADTGGAAALVGRVAVPARRGGAASKDYGPSVRVEPPDPPAGAVWVDGGAPPLDPTSATPLRIEQRGLQFRPGLAVVRTGTPVIFANEDDLYHSVFSYSPAKRFDLGRHRRGEQPPALVLDAPGIVQLFCEVHEHMRGYALVVDTPWFARTDADGRFAIEGIPPGHHRVSIWLPPKQTVVREIDLAPGQRLEVDWRDIAGNDPR